MSYLHLMPLLEPRPGENDGGYAVMDYRAVDPRVGTMDDLEVAARALRERGMSLCVDLVLNHTAREHAWAKAWLAGDPEYADFYFAFPDRTMPDAYEATISDVFPDRAPGSFTWVGTANGGRGAWVWTTFFGVPVGPQLRQPERLRRRSSTRSSGWPTAASRSSAWTPCRSCGSGWAPRA